MPEYQIVGRVVQDYRFTVEAESRAEAKKIAERCLQIGAVEIEFQDIEVDAWFLRDEEEEDD